MKKSMILIAFLSACTTVEEAPLGAPREVLWSCHAQSTCAARHPATVSEALEACVATSDLDGELPGAAAAAEYAAQWRLECESRQGIADLSGEDLCRDDLGEESWGCAIECAPELTDCDP